MLKNDLIIDCLAIFCLSHVSWAKRCFCEATEGMFETDEIYFIFMDIYNNEQLWHYSRVAWEWVVYQAEHNKPDTSIILSISFTKMKDC